MEKGGEGRVKRKEGVWFEDVTFQERGKFQCLEANEFIVCI